MQIPSFEENDFMRTGGMCDDCQPKEPHARSAAGNLLKICGNAYYEGF